MKDKHIEKYYRTMETLKYMGVGIPKHLRQYLAEYIVYGYVPCGFLLAVLGNDLRRSVEMADSRSADAITSLVSWLYNYAPLECWGSPQKVGKWMEIGGLNGKLEMEAKA